VNGFEYRQLIGRYVVSTYATRGIDVYEEISLGTSTLGKTRRIDLLLIEKTTGRGLAIECKYQDSAGTADEKIPYALDELRALRIPGAIVYAGGGFSDGVLHLLQSSPLAAYCLPDTTLQPMARARGGEAIQRGTWQLDLVFAQTFGFCDFLLGDTIPLALVRESKSQDGVSRETKSLESPRVAPQNVPSTPIEVGPTSSFTED
jgi:hypothetical protein